MGLTHFGTASERAKVTGKPHIWWDGRHWNAVTPDGYSGHLAATPAKALEYARQGPEFFRRLDELAADRRADERRRERIEDARERDEHRASRVWLASDPDASRPNTRIVC